MEPREATLGIETSHYVEVLNGLRVGGLSCAPLLRAQDIHHNNIYIGGEGALPMGSDTNYLNAAPMVSFGYGYRFNRLFQADIGLQIAFGAANNQNPEFTDLGYVQGGDREHMLPLGGRVYLPYTSRGWKHRSVVGLSTCTIQRSPIRIPHIRVIP
ncbi:MAG TPA: hypothetical protein VH325_02760 [Bryobacteraceae bacterium]|nr:hypothetical protein [Bryobacteraceae bacterium]